MKLRSITNLLTLLLALAGCFVAIVLTYEEFHPKADIGCSKFGGDCEKALSSKEGHLGPIPTSVIGLGMYLTIAGLCVARFSALRAVRRRVQASRAYANALPEEGAGPGLSANEVLEGQAEETPVGTSGGAFAADSGPAGTTSPFEERSADPAAPAMAALNRLNAAVWSIAAAAVMISWWLQHASLYGHQPCFFCPWCFSSATLVTLIFLLSTYDLALAGRTLDGEQKLLAWVAAFIIAGFGVVGGPLLYTQIQACGALSAKTGIDVPGPQEPPPTTRSLIMVKGLRWIGDPKAKYALVEFGDYQCGHCKKAVATVAELLKSPPEGGVRFTFRNFPLVRHTWAFSAAAATEAAGEQGKYWEMHDLIYQHQEDLDKPAFSRARYDEWAKSLGLDLNRFSKDCASQKTSDSIGRDVHAGDATGLSLTPSFYLVTPTRVTLFSGTEDLIKMWHDPKSPYWK